MAEENSRVYKLFSKFLTLLGTVELLSAFFVTSYIYKFWNLRPVSYRIVSVDSIVLKYLSCSVVLGLITLFFGVYLSKKRKEIFYSISILFVFISVLVLTDRLILVKFGLPPWIPDTRRHYKNRPYLKGIYKAKTWKGEIINAVSRTNRYGYQDDDFSQRKPKGELRGVMLGDSAALGYGVDPSDTYSNQLEKMLRKADKKYRTYQIINTGVAGYSTFQEYYVFKEALKFKPDFVTLGFSMNDIVEPFLVNTDFGGAGFDYHHVRQSANPLIGYLLNETGLGRLIQRLNPPPDLVTKNIGTIKEAAMYSDTDPRFITAWKRILNDLSKIYRLADDNHIKIILLIFPCTYQLGDIHAQVPQKILINNAKKHNVDVIDFTKVFESIVSRSLVYEKGSSKKEMNTLANKEIEKYYLDTDHFSEEGHRVVALRLLKLLTKDKRIKKK